jgi:hypothetical protein
MRKSLIFVMALSGMVTACASSTPATNGGTTTTVTMTPAQLSAEAAAVAAALQVGVTAYVTAGGSISAQAQTDFTAAETTVNGLIPIIANAEVGPAAVDALTVVNTLTAATNEIPSLPIDVKAGLIGLQAVVAALDITDQPAAAVMGISPVHKAPIGHVVAPTLPTVAGGSKLRVHLVANS